MNVRIPSYEESALGAAASNGHRGIVELLLENKADINHNNFVSGSLQLYIYIYPVLVPVSVFFTLNVNYSFFAHYLYLFVLFS